MRFLLNDLPILEQGMRLYIQAIDTELRHVDEKATPGLSERLLDGREHAERILTMARVEAARNRQQQDPAATP